MITEDNKISRYSYSALSQFENCPYAYYQKYIQKQRPEENTIALSIGTILHKARELCSLALMEGQTPDYTMIRDITMNGWAGVDKANSKKEEVIPGMEEIKALYWEDWMKEEPDIPSYQRRLETFFEHLEDDEKDILKWRPIAAEKPFTVAYQGAELFGVIDKIEENKEGQIRIVDLKSSKKPYDESKLKSPLQLYIYHLAVQDMFPDREIISHRYDFIMLGEQREAGTRGWLKRCDAKLTKLLESIRQANATNLWEPKPSPLCYWCPYCRGNPTSKPDSNSLCRYYSLWTPQKKTFETNEPWIKGTKADEEKIEIPFSF